MYCYPIITTQNYFKTTLHYSLTTLYKLTPQTAGSDRWTLCGMALWGGEIDKIVFGLVQALIWTCLDCFVTLMLQIWIGFGQGLEIADLPRKGAD